MAHAGYDDSIDTLVKLLNRRRVYNYFIKTVKDNHFYAKPIPGDPKEVLKKYTEKKKRRDWVSLMYPWFLTKQGYEFWEMVDMEWKTLIGAVDRGRL